LNGTLTLPIAKDFRTVPVTPQTSGAALAILRQKIDAELICIERHLSMILDCDRDAVTHNCRADFG
jgi:hypothetical protein